MDLVVALNSIAREMFRDQADRDYVTARAVWHLRYRDQFLWSALQAFEKYLKGILLFNGVSARFTPAPPRNGRRIEYGHLLSQLMASVRRIPGLVINTPVGFDQYLQQLEDFGQNRYITRSTYSRFDSLQRLDVGVWHIRRYCEFFRVEITTATGAKKDLFDAYVRSANRPGYEKRPHTFRLLGGLLERLIAGPATDPARKALIWQNLHYGRRHRGKATYAQWSSSVVAPVHRTWLSDAAFRKQVSEYVRLE